MSEFFFCSSAPLNVLSGSQRGEHRSQKYKKKQSREGKAGLHMSYNDRINTGMQPIINRLIIYQMINNVICHDYFDLGTKSIFIDFKGITASEMLNIIVIY